MSLLTAFCSAASGSAGAIIGFESLTIGAGAAVNSIMSEVSEGSQYEATGYAPESSLECVVRRADWDVSYSADGRQYRKSTATARGKTWSIARIVVGAAFVTVSLSEKERS
jgi:hypothetical protein